MQRTNSTGKERDPKRRKTSKGNAIRSSNVVKMFINKKKSEKKSENVPCPACNTFVPLKSINEHLDKYCGQEGQETVIGETRFKPEKRKRENIIVIDDDCESDDKSNNESKDFCKESNYSKKNSTSPENLENFNVLIRSNLFSESEGMDKELLAFRKGLNPFRGKDVVAEGKTKNSESCSHSGTPDSNKSHCNKSSMVFVDDSSMTSLGDCDKSAISNCSGDVCKLEPGTESISKTLTASQLQMNTNENDLDEGANQEQMAARHSLEESKSDSDLQAEMTEKSFEPYYWENFNFVVDSVLDETTSLELFSCEDTELIKKFKSTSQLAQQLYVRLFLRKHGWFKTDKIKYPKIGEDLKPMITELINTGFLDDKSTLEDLNEILNIMSAPEVRSLAQLYHLLKDRNGKKLSTKEEMIIVILNHGNNQRSVKSFFVKSSHTVNTMKAGMIKKSKSLLGDCVKISEKPRELFSRCFSLFTYMNFYLYEDGNTKSNLIYRILQIKKGELIFPSYKITKSATVFKSRDDVINYNEATQTQEEFYLAMEDKDFDKALILYQKARKEVDNIFLKLQSTDGLKIRSTELPVHLRKFSPEWIYFRICCKSVEALEKKGCYEEAVNLARLILLQSKYCLRSRGALWERLVIDTERYLKDPSQALEYIKTAIEDPWVRTGVRLSLFQKAKRICMALKNKHLKARISEFEAEQLDNVNELTISAPVFLDTSSSNRTIFLMEGGDKTGRQEYSAVEEYTLSYFKEQGYPEGVHGEGAPYTFIFTLLFWEIIFMDFEDVFHGPFQGCPLDFYTDNFYEARKDQIDIKLQELRNCTKEELAAKVEESWSKHEGQVCVASNWSLFNSLQQVQGLVSCLSGQIVAGICEIFCKDYRNRCSGMPDLLVWNPETLKCKAVEVKGPGDRLSNKQIIWLNVLTSLGMDAGVCYVKGVGGKRRRLSKD
ncbi:fanconi-associated nuclease 1-like [Rhopilema esculentum]|uniref:fanconi-associated nuclease 1-like n=1 Tax=Rhopilema esculentum TaxID=499914 RepID=UPI0031E41328|eukprot:gene6203-11608_t